MTRTLTLLLVPAANPDELDDMAYEQRRSGGGGWTQFELLYPGDPDTLVRMSLDIDQGVYGAARARDEACVEQTSAIFHTEVESAAELLRPHLADPLALAACFIDYAESGEEPSRVARALVEPMTDPARGPAEEAATYVRIFMENVPAALELQMGIAWEIRAPASCPCAVWEGQSLGRYIEFSPREFERLEGSGKYFGRMRCVRCSATLEFKISANDAEVTRETTPLPALGVFAKEVAEALGGEVAFDVANNPTCAVRLGQHCVVVISLYGAYYRLTLPHACSWKVRSREDWVALEPTIKKAIAGYRRVVSMADVIASLPRTWNVSLTVGEPRAEEGLLHNAGGEVHLKQNAESVTLIIWEGSSQHVREVATLDALDGLSAWIDETVSVQARSRQAANVAFAAQRAAEHAAMMMRVPELEDVMAVLREGQSIQVGGGRSFPTYAMRDGRVIVIQSDDGFTEESPCSEERLRAAIAEAPNVFDSAVQSRLGVMQR